MKKNNAVFWALLTVSACLLCAAEVSSAPSSAAGSSVGTFLKIGVGARPVAMGESFVALADDVNALYWNPAGINQLEKMQATFMYNAWLNGVAYNYAGIAAKPFGYGSAVGASVIMLDTGKIDGNDINDAPYSYDGEKDFVISGTYGKELQENVLLGISLKSVRQSIENESASGTGIDLGAIYKLSDNLLFGLAVQNLTFGQMKFVGDSYSLPRIIRAGMGFRTSGFSFENPLVLAVELDMPADNDPSVGGGGEYWLSDMFVVRAGYRMQLGGGGYLGGTTGLTLGCGFKYSLRSGESIIIDFAGVPYGDLGYTFRGSLMFKF
jgi:hypothetical protein